MAVEEPRTRAQVVAEGLRSMIMSGEMPPGTRLRQVELAAQFSVSTTPVREALTSLAREGLVRQDTHRMVEVFRPSVKDIHENYEMRLALEPLAAELAAGPISRTDVAELERLLTEMNEAVDFRVGTELNRRFHALIYQAADRPLLFETIERLRQSADAYVQLLVGTRTSSAYIAAVHEEHAAIAAALAAHSRPRARKAMAAHLRHSLAEISRRIPPES